MPLKFPATFRDVSVIKGHPFYNPNIITHDLVVFLNGEPIEGCVTASMTNGYVHIHVKDSDGNYRVHPKHPDRLLTKRLKGTVELFYNAKES